MTARQWLAAGATIVTVALTGAAFWLSYEHLHDVAAASGLGADPARAWAWPATVDLFIVAGELLILRASLAHRVDWPAVVLAAVGSLGSIALNVAGVGTGAPVMEYIVAAIPPTAALLAFGALMRQVHEALAVPETHPAVTPVTVPETAEIERVPAPEVQAEPAYPQLPPPVPAALQAVPAGAQLLPIVGRPQPQPATRVLAADQARPRTQVHAEYEPEPEDDSPPPPAEDLLTPRARDDFTNDLATGRTPPIRALRETYSIGQVRAQRIQRELSTP